MSKRSWLTHQGKRWNSLRGYKISKAELPENCLSDHNSLQDIHWKLLLATKSMREWGQQDWAEGAELGPIGMTFHSCPKGDHTREGGYTALGEVALMSKRQFLGWDLSVAISRQLRGWVPQSCSKCTKALTTGGKAQNWSNAEQPVLRRKWPYCTGEVRDKWRVFLEL